MQNIHIPYIYVIIKLANVMLCGLFNKMHFYDVYIIGKFCVKLEIKQYYFFFFMKLKKYLSSTIIVNS